MGPIQAGILLPLMPVTMPMRTFCISFPSCYQCATIIARNQVKYIYKEKGRGINRSMIINNYQKSYPSPSDLEDVFVEFAKSADTDLGLCL